VFTCDARVVFQICRVKKRWFLGRSPRPRWGSFQRSPIPPCWAGGCPPPAPSPGLPLHFLFSQWPDRFIFRCYGPAFEEKPQKELEIAVIRGQSPQDGLIQQLVQRLEKIELELSASRPERGEGSAEKERQVTQGRGRSTTCWYCGRRGHLSRECFKKQREQGNSRPSAH